MAKNKIEPFWKIGTRGGIHPEIEMIFQFMNAIGFRKKYTPEKEVEIYRIDKPFFERKTVVDMENELRCFILSDELTETFGVLRNDDQELTGGEIWEAILKFGLHRIFGSHNLHSLWELKVTELRHTATDAYFCYKNGYVHVTKEGYRLLEYKGLQGAYIDAEKVIQRDFVDVMNIEQEYTFPDGETYTQKQEKQTKGKFTGGFAFIDFTKRIAHEERVTKADGQETKEVIFSEPKHSYLMKLLGFALHDYKSPGMTDFAPFFWDNEKGGSGKGIIIQAISQFVKVASVPAEREERFDPETMTDKTRIKVYSDVGKDFNMRKAYDEITEYGYIRQMHRNPIIVPYADSYKVFFTGNYQLKGNNSSDRRRQRVYEVFPYFSDKLTPKDEYGCTFFNSTWQGLDWNIFDCTMLTGVVMWLGCDYHLHYKTYYHDQLKIELSYQEEFRYYMETLPRGVELETGILFEDFKFLADPHNAPLDRPASTNIYKGNKVIRNMTANAFGRNVTRYLDDTGQEYTKNSNKTKITIHKPKATT